MPHNLTLNENIINSHLFSPLSWDKINQKRQQHPWLGEAQSSPALTPNGKGWYQHFQNGSIYWSKETGAWEVHGEIRSKWASLGWENSFMGFPVTDETATPDGRGRFNHFEGGSIYWTPDTGAWEVHGEIRSKWASLGWERSFLGYPVSDELPTPDGGGRFNNFQNGQIAWAPEIGAAVSATSFQQHQGGGVLPQGLSPNGVPDIRRKIVIVAHMKLTDHETFGSNELSEAELRRESIILNGEPQETLTMTDRAGGELRVQLSLKAQALLTGDVRLTGQALLYEGTSEESNDLDGDEEITFIAPRDNFTSKTYTVINEDEGGDSGLITLTVSNFPV